MSSVDVKQYIESHRDAFIQELQEFCRIPSIPGIGHMMQEGADATRELLERRGVSTRIVETAGHPAVYGEIRGASDRTLLLYTHYDVQGPGTLEEWDSGPFDAEIHDGRIYARGVSDHKGSLTSRIHALETVQAIWGQPPVTLKFIIEGEEEIGSPSLPGLLEANKELLQADAALYSGGRKDENGNAEIRLGSKGMCYVKLTCRGARADAHSSFAPLLVNPAWRLTWLLNTLKDPETDRVLIDGFYDDVETPTHEDIASIKSLNFNAQKFRDRYGVDDLLGGREGWEAALHLYYTPTCTICGLSSGYGAEATTVLPNSATARIDFRLVRDQSADDILTKLKAHLEKHGFGDVEVEKVSMLDPQRVPLTHPLAKVVERAARRAYGDKVLLYPTSAGSGPRFLFRRILGLPMVSDVGNQNPGSSNHGPNENIRISDYVESVEHLVYLFEEFGAVDENMKVGV